MLLLAGAAPSLAAQESPTVVTSGQGAIALAPDHAEVHFTVETRARSAVEAAAENDGKVATLLDQLATLGEALDSVEVVAVSVMATENYQRREIVGYQASATVLAHLRDLSRLAGLYDIALVSGVTRLGQIQFLSDSTEPARAAAIKAAFAAARADAMALAEAAGSELGQIVTVRVDGPAVMPRRGVAQMATLEAADAGRISVAPDPQDVMVNATVTVTWRLATPEEDPAEPDDG